MKIPEIEENHKFDNYPYAQICNCGKTIELLTQKDNHPEYYTNVFVLCDCGEYVLFQLPVN